jgi:hypothetical protein
MPKRYISCITSLLTGCTLEQDTRGGISGRSKEGIQKNTQYTNITESTTRKSYTNSKQEIRTIIAVQGVDTGRRRGRSIRRRIGLDPEQDGSWKDGKKEGVMEGVSAPGRKDRRRKKNGLYCTQYRGGGVGTEMISCCADMMSCCADMKSCCAEMMSFCAAMMSCCDETIATRSRLCS